LAASLENNSEHPLAEAIISYAEKRKIKPEEISYFKAIPGYGVEGKIGSIKYLLGNRKLALKAGLKLDENKINNLENEGKTVMILASEREVFGLVAVADVIKETTKEAISTLSKRGIEIYMITGDNLRTAKAIAEQAELKNILAEVLPKDRRSR